MTFDFGEIGPKSTSLEQKKRWNAI